MSRTRILWAVALLGICGLGVASWLLAADHGDADSPASVAMFGPADITDVYVFNSPSNPNNLVVACGISGPNTPANSAAKTFDSRLMLEFNIDNNNDNVEDLVIQTTFEDGKMQVRGPVAPSAKGTTSKKEGSITVEVPITAYAESKAGTINVLTANGVTAFAGMREDPFFFDLARFNQTLSTGTLQLVQTPGMGTDFFAGQNTPFIILEVPKTRFAAHQGRYLKIWAEAKFRQ